MEIKVAVLIGAIALALGIWGFVFRDFFQFFTSVPKCHSTFKHHVKHLATKSPYIYNENLLYNYEVSYKNVTSFIPKGCSSEKIWFIARHGSRQPAAKIIERILNELEPLRNEIIKGHESNESGQLCTSEIGAFKSWNPFPDLHPSKEKWLVPSGYVELHGIGTRFQKNFPNLFPNTYKAETYKFKYTKTQRAEASAKSFAYGLFGDDEAEKVQYPPALDADPVLRFYKACPKWKKQVDKNPIAYAEQKKFEKTKIFLEMHDKIRDRLGLKSTRRLSISEIELMHLACSFETAFNPQPKSKEQISPWCSVFSEEDLKILEYRQDLEYYWIDGYGYEITFKHACAPIRDVLEQFKEKIESPESAHKVTAYFTHSGTVLKFLSHLQLFRDNEALRADNFELHKDTRKWRTSFIDKFATNIAFVLFKCTDEKEPQRFIHKIGTLFQEHPIETKFCDDKWICPFEQFVNYFNDTVNTCNVDSMCKL